MIVDLSDFYATIYRELAFQISEQFAVLGGALNLHTAVVVGGMDMMTQALELGQRPHVVVATPGRIVDHLKSSGGEWNLSRVKFLVGRSLGNVNDRSLTSSDRSLMKPIDCSHRHLLLNWPISSKYSPKKDKRVYLRLPSHQRSKQLRRPLRGQEKRSLSFTE